jgi:hypothetical protein
MDPFFNKISFLKHLQRAYDKKNNVNNPTQQLKRKRGRSEWEEETNDELFLEILQIMTNEDVFATFRTLLMESFRALVATKGDEQNQYYQQVLNIIVDFRTIICEAEQLFLIPTRQYDFYFYMVDDVCRFLQRAKHPILLFHLSLN